MFSLENLYNNLLKKIKDKYIKFIDNSIYIYPEIKISTFVGFILSFFFLGFLLYFLILDQNLYIKSLVIIFYIIIFLLTFLFLYLFKNKAILVLDEYKIFYKIGLYKCAIKWEDIVNFRVVEQKQRHQTLYFLAIDVSSKNKDISKLQKFNSIFGYGVISISQQFLPIKIHDLYKILGDFLIETRKQN